MAPLAIAICRNFEADARAALAGLAPSDVALAVFPPRCGRPPLDRGEVAELVEGCSCDRAEVLGSICCSGLGRTPDLPRGWRVHALESCFELVAPRAMLAPQLRAGAYVLTPGWLRRWREEMREEGLDDAELARELFGESITKLLLLDTGVDRDAPARLQELAEHLALPAEVIPVGVEFLRDRLLRLRAEAALAAERSAHRAALTAAHQQSAEYAAAFDVVGCLADSVDEQEVVERAIDVCVSLFAPGRVAYLPIGGSVDGIQVRPPLADPGEVPRLADQLSRGLEPTRGFAFPIEHRGQRFGVLAVEEVAFPEFRDRYLVLASTVARVCAMAVANARAFHEVKVANDSLALERERLAVTLHSIGDGVIATDREGKVLLVNKVCAELTGFAVHEAVGRPLAEVFQVFDERTREPIQNPVEQVLRIGRAVDLINGALLVSRDGTVHHVADSAAPILDRDGTTLGVVLVFRDVTAQKHKRKLQRVLDEATRLLASSLDMSRVLHDIGSRVAAELEQGCAIDVTAGEQRARPDADATAAVGAEAAPAEPPQLGARTVEDRRRAVLVSGAVRHERIAVAELGDVAPPRAVQDNDADLLVVPVRSGDEQPPRGTIAFTSVATMDDEHVRFARELARRVALALENAALLETTRHAVLVRDRFLSMASHELRTPLTSLQLRGETMSRWLARGEAPSSEQVERFTAALLRAVGRLRGLVEDMLDVSRMNSGKLALRVEQVDLSRLVAAELESRDEELRAAGYAVTSRIEPGVVGRWDPQRIEQVVANLVGNAIRYGRGEPIDIVLSRDDQTATLLVRDRGTGIDPRDHARIFRAFERAAREGEGSGGLGLGLYIVAQILAAHGGSVTVESAPGVGSTFVVHLPLGIEYPRPE
jgi:PAS domain S-box-containing protein